MAGLTIWLPEVEVAEVHPAEHPVAFVEVQVNVEVAPSTIELGLALSVTAISGVPPPQLAVHPPGVTVTVAEAVAVLPLPAQLMV